MIFAAVALVAAVHTLLYVFAVPPWALEDEEQHVDYVLNLRDERKPPHLDDHIDQDVIDSAVATDRWEAFDLRRPDAATADEHMDPARMGLEGFSYEGHQPPLYYAVLTPVATVAGDHLLVFLYAGRAIGALLLAAAAVLVATLGARWAPPGRAWLAAWVGGLAVALLPANAEAAARINNDYACAVLVTAGVVCLLRALDEPGSRWCYWAGLVFAAAIMTKPGGVVGVGAALCVLGLLAAQRRFSWRVAAALLVPQAVAVGSWALVSHARFGEWNASTAQVDRLLRFPVLSWSDLASQALDRAATPYGVWSLGTALTVGWLAFAATGLGLLWRSAGRTEAYLMVASIALITCAGVLSLNNAGMVNAFTARYVVFAYPVLFAAAGAGWARLSRPSVALAPVAVAAVAAAVFFVGDFLPDFPLRVG